MLRKQEFVHSLLPLVAVAQWVAHTPRKVKVKIFSEDKKTLLREEEQTVIDSEIVTPASQVRKDTADMYSVENLQEAGISPVFLTQPYLRQSFDSVHMSQVEDAVNSQLELKQQEPTPVEPTAVESKTE